MSAIESESPQANSPNRAMTWTFSTVNHLKDDPLYYTVSLKPIREFGRRGLVYQGPMTHYERVLDKVIGTEGMEGFVAVRRRFKGLDGDPPRYETIFTNMARVYRAHDDPYDLKKARVATLRKLLKDAHTRVKQDVFGVVLGTVETMEQVRLYSWKRSEPPLIRYGTNWVPVELLQDAAPKSCEEQKSEGQIERLADRLGDCGSSQTPVNPLDRLVAKLMDMGLNVGVWKAK